MTAEISKQLRKTSAKLITKKARTQARTCTTSEIMRFQLFHYFLHRLQTVANISKSNASFSAQKQTLKEIKFQRKKKQGKLRTDMLTKTY